MVTLVVPLKPMEVPVRTDIYTAAHRGPHAGAGGCVLKEAVAHEEPTGSWLKLRPVKRSTYWIRFVGRTCDPLEDPDWSSLFLKDYSSRKGSMLEQPTGRIYAGKVNEGLYLIGGTPCWTREECMEEGMAKMKSYEKLQTLFSILLCCSRGGGRRDWKEVEPGKRGWVQGKCFQICCYFSLTYSDSLAIHYFNFPKSSLFHP